MSLGKTFDNGTAEPPLEINQKLHIQNTQFLEVERKHEKEKKVLCQTRNI